MSALDAVTLVDIPTIRDDRGALSVVEAERDVPFPIRRVFFMHHMLAERGGHAHRDTAQVVLAAAGSLRLELTDGKRTISHTLADPSQGVYMPPMVFVRIRDISPDAICLVLADTHYDMSRSLRTYEAYLEAIAVS
jgi:dTDP-4-dehydrorhamnose 3,5-epimerase-like enzyme